ncbi:MAG: hypothetical protein H5T41_10635 [Methanomassiliicoccales archaeon]|nr:hypothetical protein [Methanomassiliicoccales archaeon]
MPRGQEEVVDAPRDGDPLPWPDLGAFEAFLKTCGIPLFVRSSKKAEKEGCHRANTHPCRNLPSRPLGGQSELEDSDRGYLEGMREPGGGPPVGFPSPAIRCGSGFSASLPPCSLAEGEAGPC